MSESIDALRPSCNTPQGGRSWYRVVCGAAIAAFCALTPVMAHAQISVLLQNLPPHGVTSRSLGVQAEVTSNEELISVRAQVDAAIVDLDYSLTVRDGVTRWTGSVPLTGSYGTRTLTVTATGVSGAQGTASASFPFYPNPPADSSALMVFSPSAGDVARPTIEVDATFSDPNPPSLAMNVAYVPAPRHTVNITTDLLPLSGSGRGIRGTVDLSAFDPSSGNLVFLASTAYGPVAEVWVPIEVRSAPDVEDAGAQEDAAVPSDDAAVPSDDAAVPSDDAAVPSDDAAVPTEDAGACLPDAGPTHEWPHRGHHPHRHWIKWPRPFNCSTSPQPLRVPRAWPGVLTGLLAVLLVTRRRRPVAGRRISEQR